MVAVLEKDTKNCYFYQDNPPWGSFFCLSEFFHCSLVSFLGQKLNNQGSQEYIHIKVLKATVNLWVFLTHQSMTKIGKTKAEIPFFLKLLSNLFPAAQNEQHWLNNVQWKKKIAQKYHIKKKIRWAVEYERDTHFLQYLLKSISSPTSKPSI